MSDYSINEDKKKAAIEAMITAINTQAPLPIDVIQQWLQASELSTQDFADLMGRKLSTVKNWIFTYKKIPGKNDKAVRQKILMKIGCDSSFRAGAFSTTATSSEQQEQPEKELTYQIDPLLYSILNRLALRSRRTVYQTISDAVYAWTSDLMGRGIFERPVADFKQLSSSIRRAEDSIKSAREQQKKCENRISVYKKNKQSVQQLAAIDGKPAPVEELEKLDGYIDAETNKIDTLKEAIRNFRDLKWIMERDFAERPVKIVNKSRRTAGKRLHP